MSLESVEPFYRGKGTVADLDASFLLIYGCDISKRDCLGYGNIAQSRQDGKEEFASISSRTRDSSCRFTPFCHSFPFVRLQRLNPLIVLSCRL